MLSDSHVLFFDTLRRGDVALVGGKNSSLGEMVQELGELGVAVPPGFATTSDACRGYIAANGLNEFIAQSMEDWESGKKTLAETGHAVFSTFHTHSSVHTIQRLVGLFPLDRQNGVRERLADTLRAVVSQRLLPMAKTRGRVIATEVLVNNYAVKECLRDQGRLKSLTQVLERSNDQNMHSFDQSLIQLVQARSVDPQVALTFASSPSNLRRALSLSGVAA